MLCLNQIKVILFGIYNIGSISASVGLAHTSLVVLATIHALFDFSGGYSFDLRPELQLLFGGVNADFGRRPVWTGTYIVVVFDGSRWTRSRS